MNKSTEGWICKTCKNACLWEWNYCPYCGEPGPDEDE